MEHFHCVAQGRPDEHVHELHEPVAAESRVHVVGGAKVRTVVQRALGAIEVCLIVICYCDLLNDDDLLFCCDIQWVNAAQLRKQ